MDHLVREMLDACWRGLPDDARSLAAAKRLAQEVFDRNMAVWAKIKQPSPAAFFENLLTNDRDQFMRQAMVMCWMMMPRVGGRKVSEVRKIVGEIFKRNISGWEADEVTFTGKKQRITGAAAKQAKSRAAKPPKKRLAKKSRRPAPKRSR